MNAPLDALHRNQPAFIQPCRPWSPLGVRAARAAYIGKMGDRLGAQIKTNIDNQERRIDNLEAMKGQQ